jgi:hypothetical protein
VEGMVRDGLNYEQVAQKLNYTPKWTTNGSSLSSVDGGEKSNGKGKAATAAAPAAAPPAKRKDEPAQVGKPLGNTPSRNPLDMIKVGDC